MAKTAPLMLSVFFEEYHNNGKMGNNKEGTDSGPALTAMWGSNLAGQIKGNTL